MLHKVYLSHTEKQIDAYSLREYCCFLFLVKLFSKILQIFYFLKPELYEFIEEFILRNSIKSIWSSAFIILALPVYELIFWNNLLYFIQHAKRWLKIVNNFIYEFSKKKLHISILIVKLIHEIALKFLIFHYFAFMPYLFCTYEVVRQNVTKLNWNVTNMCSI